MEEGCSFHWESYSDEPYLVTPNGEAEQLLVRNGVPYLIPPRAKPTLPVTDDAGDLVNEAEGEVDDVVGFSPDGFGDLTVDPVGQLDALNDAEQASPSVGVRATLRPGVRDLHAEAQSVGHLMTHVPKNPYCAACQTAKMQRRPHRRGAWRQTHRGNLHPTAARGSRRITLWSPPRIHREPLEKEPVWW